MPKKAKEEGLLTSAAKAIGRTAGTIAAAVGATGDAPEAAPRARAGKGRLPKKDKSRLPRRQKKALRKSAARPNAAA